MQKSDSPYVAQILRNLEKVRVYLGDETYETFCADNKTQSAILMQLQMIGELAKRISPQAREEMKEIPWIKVAGFRDIVAHEYYDIQLPVVWAIITEELDLLERVLAIYLKKHPIPELPDSNVV